MSVHENFNTYGMPSRVRKFITWKGKTLSVIDWARIRGISPQLIYNRQRRMTDPEEILRNDNLRGRGK